MFLLAGLLTGTAANALPEVPDSPPGVVSAEDGPVNETPPSISGDAVVGGILTSTGGQWSNAAWIHYNWVADGQTVLIESLPVGTPSTLDVENALVGATIRLTVLASAEQDGPGVELAADPVTVLEGTFHNVVWSDAVNGTPKVGQDLSVNVPVWTGPFGMVAGIGYQWYRGGVAIAGATEAKYTAAAADSGMVISARVGLSLHGFTPLSLASRSVTLGAGTFTVAPAPTVAGTARVGQLQTANPGNWAPTGATLSYQWYRGSTAITGATARTYTAGAADNGKALKVRVRAAKAGFTTVERYSAPRTIAAGVFTPTKSVTVTGAFRFGQTLRVSQAWLPAPTTIQYQWYRNGVAIKGGTSPYLYLNSGYIGSNISVKLTLSKAGFTSRSTTTVRTLVRNAVMSTQAAPKITGTLKAGYTLTASNGSYSPAPTSVGFQWYRNGAAISGARNRGYKLASADNGKSITVRATAYKQFHDARVAASAAVTIPQPPVTVLSRDGVYKVGTNIKPGLYKATGTGTGCYWERTSGFSGSLSQIKANYFGTARTYVQILAGDVGFKTSGCGSWTTVTTSGARATKITVDGTYRVGIDILPGTYYGSSSGNSCYWATASDFSGDFDAFIDGDYGSARTIIDVPASATSLRVSRCGTLTRR